MVAMKLSRDPKFESLLARLFQREHLQEEASSLLNEFLSIPVEEKQAVFASLKPGFPFRDYFCSFFYEDVSALYEEGLKKGIRCIDPTPLLSENPYWEKLRDLKIQEGNLKLIQKEVGPYSLYPYSFTEVGSAPFYEETPCFAYSDHSFSYPEFSSSGRPWMSLLPHEILTMQEPIQNAKGKVLTYGLGMGYFAYMACLKEDVSSVTAVEKDPAVLAFFREHLLPFFPKQKLILIKGDALEFAGKGEKGSYDFLFMDVHHDAEDGLPLYLRFKKSEGIALRSEYWIERDILVYLRRYLIAFLEEQNNPEIAKEGGKAYLPGKDFPSRLFSEIYRLSEGISLESEGDLAEFLSDENLKRMAAELKVF